MRGKCSVCGYSVELRKDESAGSHVLYGYIPGRDSRYRQSMEKKGRRYRDDGSYICEGTGKPVTVTYTHNMKLREIAKLAKEERHRILEKANIETEIDSEPPEPKKSLSPDVIQHRPLFGFLRKLK